jgi:hypothetical protein
MAIKAKSHILGVDCDQDSVAFSPCNERGKHRGTIPGYHHGLAKLPRLHRAVHIEGAPLATSPGCRKGETLCIDDDADEHASFPSGSPSQTDACAVTRACLFLSTWQATQSTAGGLGVASRAGISLSHQDRRKSIV